MKRVLAIDQGTTATKTYTLDLDGRFSFCYSTEHRQIYPQPGWVEHDPEALLRNVLDSIEAAEEFDAIGIDNQAEHMTLELAGLPLDPYFSASKLRWILEHVPEARKFLREGRLRLGTSEAIRPVEFYQPWPGSSLTRRRCMPLTLASIMPDQR